MKKILMTLSLTVLLTLNANAGEGMITIKSAHSVSETANRLESILQSKGMTVMKRIDHAAGASRVGQQLRPTELLVFGNPKIGTPLMQCSQTIAIDLPQKALIWEDEAGQVWLAYNDPQFLKLRHGTEGCDEVLARVATALGNFAAAATAQ